MRERAGEREKERTRDREKRRERERADERDRERNRDKEGGGERHAGVGYFGRAMKDGARFQCKILCWRAWTILDIGAVPDIQAHFTG